jgi:heparan-alpha-glucosaminide N-acetyltransferase
MISATVSPTASQPTGASTSRLVSIDIFRGLTMAVMIFVNAVAEVRGLPWWTNHAHAWEDRMTYVDMVFPFFLFAAGLSMPLAISQRLKRNPSTFALCLHIVSRVLGLLVLGFILANAEKADPTKMALSGGLWALLGLLCMMLFLNVYPRWERFPAYAIVLQTVGLAGTTVLLGLFRRTTHSGQTAWLDPSYPEILGLIGYTYLAVAFLYLLTRRWRWAPALWFVLLVGLCASSTARLVAFPVRLPPYFWPFGNGALACIMMAGVVTSILFLGAGQQPSPRVSIGMAAGFALLTLLAGAALTPLGISKIRATPTWSLYSVGAAILLFIALYWLCDLKRWTFWTFPLRSAGSNTLLTYLLPDLWYFLFVSAGIKYLDSHWNVGAPGVIKSLVFTAVILALSALLTRSKVRLQL